MRAAAAPDDAPAVRRFEVAGDDVRLVADEWMTTGDGVTVVLLHGGGQTRHSWDRTADRLARAGHVVYTLDLRGHGDSDWHTGADYTLDAFARDTTKFLVSLGRPAVLVGASLGGMTALLTASEAPSLVRGIVLVDVVIRVEQDGVERIRSFLNARRDGFASLEEVADAIAAYNPLRPRPKRLDGLRKNVRQRADGRWYWHWDPAFTRIDDEPQRRIRRERLEAAARSLAVPLLVVRGLRSDVVTDEGVAHMQHLVPGARSVNVRGAGHMIAGDDNDAFGAHLESFLASLSVAP